MRLLAALVLVAACSGGSSIEASPDKGKAKALEKSPVRSKAKLEKIGDLCVTKGNAAIGSTVKVPTMRAVAKASTGDAAALTFTYQGDTEKQRELASGQTRRQVGLKLRAQDGCNLVYVMWRLDPKPAIDVSVKLNPGKKTHKECGAEGYTKVRPVKKENVPVLAVGDTRTLRAEIVDDELVVWIDDIVSWRGLLPEAVRSLSGPAGIRSDNFAFDLVGFSAPVAPAQSLAKCVVEEGD